MLISVHMPKTAGSSFLASIRQHYGPRLLLDYGDRPINRSGLVRNSHAALAGVWHGLGASRFEGFECIHGHFMPLKYSLLRPRSELRFVTWLRDPVERLASLHRRVVEEQWSLERFCLGPELRNTYCKFLWSFHLDRFAFVGITEHYDDELAWFSQEILGRPVEVHRDNVNPQRDQDRYITDPELRARIEQYHERDMRLYRRAQRLREQRRAAGSGLQSTAR